MALTGPDALRALDEALRDIRREEDEIAKRSARSSELLIKLYAQEADLYRLLGADHLPADLRESQAQLIADINGTVEAAISRYDAAFADAEAGLQHAEAALARANAQRSALQSEASRRDMELTTLAAKARPKLGGDAEYAAKLLAARELAATAEAAAAKAAQAETDRERKGRPYRDDRLFMYLWTQGFGTSAYFGKGFAAWGDAQVARIIGYARARHNYELITALPVQLRAHAEALLQRAREAAADIDEIESTAIDTAGGRGPREAIEDLTGRIDALDQENVALQDRRDAAVELRSELAQGSDPTYAAALDQLAEMLGRDDLRILLAEARETPEGHDASAVQQIDDLVQRVKDETDEAREYQARLRTLALRRRGLEDIQYEVKLRGLDNPHSRFAEERLTSDLLTEFLRGGLSAGAYWERWRTSQSWTVPGYGGPGGGWGRLPRIASGASLSRPRPAPAARAISAA
jgi:hypothetical protein